MNRILPAGLRGCARLLAIVLLTSCAMPHVVPVDPGAVSPALHDDFAVMDDGFRLAVSRWGPQRECRALVVALHGLNDYRSAFVSTGEFLAGHGISVLAYDQRGFGGSVGFGLWHGTERLVADLQTMIGLAGAAHPGCPLYVLGESMGGAVTLAALERVSARVAGSILVAPAVWSRETMPLYQRAVLWLAAHIVPGRRLSGEGLDLKPSDNVDMLRALARDPLVIKATRVDVLYGMSNLMDKAAHVPPDAIGKALILYGRHDDIIPRTPTCRLVRRLPNGVDRQWRGIVYGNGYHMLTRDLQGETVLRDIVRWLLSGDGVAAGLPDNLAAYCDAD